MRNIYKVASILISLFFLYYFYRILEKETAEKVGKIISQLNPLYIVISFVSYMGSHFLRSLRISVLMGRQDYSLLRLCKLQFYTNATNLIIPFKLGEIYRIIAFNKLFKDKEGLVLSIITEKAIDLILLLFWAVLAIYLLNDKTLPIYDLSIVAVLAILFVIFVFYVVPENIRYFNLFLAKRYTTTFVNRVLKMSSAISETILNVKYIIKSNFYTLSLLTIGIWVFEVMGFFYLLPFLEHSVKVLALSVFVFLSSLIPTLTLGLGSIQLGFSAIELGDSDTNSIVISLTYQLFIFTPAVMVGLAMHLYPLVSKFLKK